MYHSQYETDTKSVKESNSRLRHNQCVFQTSSKYRMECVKIINQQKKNKTADN
jgi:hypothetical protein